MSPNNDSSTAGNTERQIIGLSLAPSLAREVKQEAARRGLTLRKLFEEIWGLYKGQLAKEDQ